MGRAYPRAEMGGGTITPGQRRVVEFCLNKGGCGYKIAWVIDGENLTQNNS